MNPTKFIDRLNNYIIDVEDIIDTYETQIKNLCKTELFKLNKDDLNKDLNYIAISLLKKHKEINYGKTRHHNGSTIFLLDGILSYRRFQQRSKTTYDFCDSGDEEFELLSWLPKDFGNIVKFVNNSIVNLKDEEKETFYKDKKVFYSYNDKREEIIKVIYEKKLKEEVYFTKYYGEREYKKGKLISIETTLRKDKGYNAGLNFMMKFTIKPSDGSSLEIIDDLTDRNIFFYLNNSVKLEVKKSIVELKKIIRNYKSKSLRVEKKIQNMLVKKGYAKYLLAREL